MGGEDVGIINALVRLGWAIVTKHPPISVTYHSKNFFFTLCVVGGLLYTIT